MKLALKFDKDSFPIFVFIIITIKECYVAFMTFFMDVANSSIDNLYYSRFIVDNFAWMPMMVFFVYFYLYRVGKVSNIGLKNSVLGALMAILPKFIVLGVHVYTYTSYNFWILLYYIMEFVTWFLIYLYLISFWNQHFRIKNSGHHRSHRSHSSGHHHHHHHHHRHYHSKDEDSYGDGDESDDDSYKKDDDSIYDSYKKDDESIDD